MEIILTIKIYLQIISLHKSSRYSLFLSRSEKHDGFHQHKICYSSIHKVALNKIRKDMIVFIFIIKTMEEDEK